MRKSTATLVLTGAYLAAKQKENEIPDVIRSYLKRALRIVDPLLFWIVSTPWGEAYAYRRQNRQLPGGFRHFATRKREILRLVESAVPTHLTVFAAGFDGLSVYASSPNFRAEVDLPEPQNKKRRILESLGADQVNLVSADLSLGVPDVWPGQRAGSMFVAEGLLMYLQRDDVISFLSKLRNMYEMGVITVMTARSDGTVPFYGQNKEVEKYVQSVGEPFTWAEPFSEVLDVLSQSGWTLVQAVGEPAYADEVDPSLLTVEPGLIHGEIILRLS